MTTLSELNTKVHILEQKQLDCKESRAKEDYIKDKYGSLFKWFVSIILSLIGAMTMLFYQKVSALDEKVTSRLSSIETKIGIYHGEGNKITNVTKNKCTATFPP